MLLFLGLFFTLVAGVFLDVRSRRIPNYLILFGWTFSILCHVFGRAGLWAFHPVLPGATGLVGWGLGVGTLLAVFLPFYVYGVMGAGDVKLMSVVGGFFGATGDAWAQLPGVALTVLACGGLLSLTRMLVSRNRSAVLANLRTISYGILLRRSGVPVPVFDPQVDSADRMPYAVAIALGTLLYVVGKWAGWITVL